MENYEFRCPICHKELMKTYTCGVYVFLCEKHPQCSVEAVFCPPNLATFAQERDGKEE